MSVGKASIKRAVNAGKAAAKTEPAEVREEKVQESVPEVKAEPEAKEAVSEPAAAEAASKTKKAPSKKTTAVKKPAASRKASGTRKPAAGKTEKTAEQAPQVKFISDEAGRQENPNRPIHITEEMPVYLL